MAPTVHTTDTPVTLRLSDQARAKLAEQAARCGQDISAVTSDLIENAVTRPSIDEILAPVRAQVAQSGMGDEEIMDFGRDLLKKVRQDRKANNQ